MSFAKFAQAKFAQAVILLLLGLTAIPFVGAQTYTVLYTFKGKSDGAVPLGGLIQDSAGNLYGTTAGNLYGNLHGGTTTGSVFKLSPSGKFTLLHNFEAGGAGGATPYGGLVQDAAGNLYGTAFQGGTNDPTCYNGCGVVFKVDAKGEFSLLYSFSGNSTCWDGCQPLAPLTLDATGNLYGATLIGGSRDCNYGKDELGLNTACGVVFKLDTAGKETVLRRFGSARKNGDNPNAGLILDAAGNLYGTTVSGGIGDHGNGYAGVVFKLDPSGNETVLHFFQEFVDGDAPLAGLIQDVAGNFYGTTNAEGTYPAVAGTVFKLDPQGNLTDLLGFGDGPGGGYPRSGLVMDLVGNLYGTTFDGGTYQSCLFGEGCGVVFKLDPSGNETVLYSFRGTMDGGNPAAGLIIDSSGNLYGTAIYGGHMSKDCPSGCGVVFKITP